jgi:hypothetical protein
LSLLLEERAASLFTDDVRALQFVMDHHDGSDHLIALLHLITIII